MDVDRCIYCANPIPEGRMVCPICEQKEVKYGSILQSQGATVEEVEKVYKWLYSNDKLIDIT